MSPPCRRRVLTASGRLLLRCPPRGWGIFPARGGLLLSSAPCGRRIFPASCGRVFATGCASGCGWVFSPSRGLVAAASANGGGEDAGRGLLRGPPRRRRVISAGCRRLLGCPSGCGGIISSCPSGGGGIISGRPSGGGGIISCRPSGCRGIISSRSSGCRRIISARCGLVRPPGSRELGPSGADDCARRDRRVVCRSPGSRGVLSAPCRRANCKSLGRLRSGPAGGWPTRDGCNLRLRSCPTACGGTQSGDYCHNRRSARTTCPACSRRRLMCRPGSPRRCRVIGRPSRSRRVLCS